MSILLSAPTIDRTQRTRTILHCLVMAGGAAALSWETIWQLKTSLAVGVSAVGTAITLAATMGGMTAGSLLMGRWLRGRELAHPVRVYGLMELIVGLSGLLLGPAFRLLEQTDAAVYRDAPEAAPLLHLAGILVVLGPPTLAMGATLPLFGLTARRYGSSIALLYGLNTLGAGVGVLVMAFVVLPALGVGLSGLLCAGINVLIAGTTWFLPPEEAGEASEKAEPEATERVPPWRALILVFVTGFATFGLEVAWFRALRAAYLSMTYSFAILLAAVLVPLAIAAHKVPELQRRRIALGTLLAAAGGLILLATPIIERFDVISRHYAFFVLPSWFVQCLLVLGPPILLLGTALPWLLDQAQDPGSWGRLYAVNTFGAILGALLAAWVLLPALGFARSAWLIGGLVLATALLLGGRRVPLHVALWGTLGLAFAVFAESGVGRSRVIGAGPASNYELVAFRETPDSTVSVIETGGRRVLFIDGFAASDETRAADYMTWMGRLPMLRHPGPRQALVICFGTGQTANAVRREGPEQLDIVDLSQAVFDLAPLFPTNERVLEDVPRVRGITMDGRAWLRRTERRYDIVTLEPMPPTFAGVNALYSREFYQLVSARLNPGGVVAQWMPFHLLEPYQAVSIAATFCEAYPGAVLWIDPLDDTGILLGRRDGGAPPTSEWPGLERSAPGRNLSKEAIIAATTLDAAGLKRFARMGSVITDDNQLLAYGWTYQPSLTNGQALAAANHELVQRAARGDVTLPGRQR